MRHHFPGPRTRGNNNDEVQYLVEKRGGWDEWSDEYQVVVGISMPDGFEIMSTLIEDTFVAPDGTPLKVEFPGRPGGYDITAERYDPEWEIVFEGTIRQLNDAIERGDVIIDSP